MLTVSLILQLLALVAFVAAAFGVSSKVNLPATGLALWLLSIILSSVR